MNHKVKYFMEFDTKVSLSRVRVEFHRKDYKLSRVHRLLGAGESPVTISYQGEETLRSAEITIRFLVRNHKLEGLKNFWTATEKDWKIFIYVNDSIFLEGFLLVTDHSTEPMTDDNYVLTLKATDGLSLLDAVDFKTVELYGPFKNTSFPYNDIPAVEIVNDYLNRRYPMSELLALGLSKTDIGSEINEYANIFEQDMVTVNSMFQQAKIHLKRLKGSGNYVKTRDVLEMILETFGQIVFQKSGKWIITSLAELSKITQKGRALNMVNGSTMWLINSSKNDLLAHASKLSRFYFVNANAFRWYVAPMRKVVAKLDYKDSISVLSNGNFASYDVTTNAFADWTKMGEVYYNRAVIEGYGSVLKFNIFNGIYSLYRGFLISPSVLIPPNSGFTLKILVKRKPTGFLNQPLLNVSIRILLKQGVKTYKFLTSLYSNEGRELKNNIIRKTSAPLLRREITNESPDDPSAHFFELDRDARINEEEFVEHYFTIQKDVIPIELESQLTISVRSGDNNFEQFVSLVECNVIDLAATIKGEYIELTNDEESKVETKNLTLNLQDDPFIYASHTLINTSNNLPTQSWRRIGREEGKSLGELTAEILFNNAINHRPYFQTDFKVRAAPYNYGDTFSYEGYKYLPQDYEYDLKNDEVKARTIRPIGNCEYSHKTEFWDILSEGGEILTLTKRYIIDSSACADLTDPVLLGQFFEFNGLAVDDNLWREAEGSGTDIIQVPFGEFFTFGGLAVEDNQWREAEGSGTEISLPNFGQFIEFGLTVNENLWREAEGAGSELVGRDYDFNSDFDATDFDSGSMPYDVPFGQFFEFEMGDIVSVWGESENAGRNPDFNPEFNEDFDSID